MGFFDSWGNTKENVVEENVVMYKPELIKAILKTTTQLKPADIGGVLDGFVSEVTKSLKNGRSVHLDKFGTFSSKEVRDENDKAETSVGFEPSEALKNAVR
jgi:nucleoid DNA-binding protein